MKALLNRDGHIVLKAESPADEKRLRKEWKAGHMHFACKALLTGNRTRIRARRPSTTLATRLFLAPSIIRWQRPAKILLVALLIGAGTLSGNTSSTIYDRDGQRVGEIRPSPYGSGYDVYDKRGNRIGNGRTNPYDESIRIYSPKTGQPLYDIRPHRRTR